MNLDIEYHPVDDFPESYTDHSEWNDIVPFEVKRVGYIEQVEDPWFRELGSSKAFNQNINQEFVYDSDINGYINVIDKNNRENDKTSRFEHVDFGNLSLRKYDDLEASPLLWDRRTEDEKDPEFNFILTEDAYLVSLFDTNYRVAKNVYRTLPKPNVSEVRGLFPISDEYTRLDYLKTNPFFIGSILEDNVVIDKILRSRNNVYSQYFGLYPLSYGDGELKPGIPFEEIIVNYIDYREQEMSLSRWNNGYINNMLKNMGKIISPIEGGVMVVYDPRSRYVKDIDSAGAAAGRVVGFQSVSGISYRNENKDKPIYILYSDGTLELCLPLPMTFPLRVGKNGDQSDDAEYMDNGYTSGIYVGRSTHGELPTKPIRYSVPSSGNYLIIDDANVVVIPNIKTLNSLIPDNDTPISFPNDESTIQNSTLAELFSRLFTRQNKVLPTGVGSFANIWSKRRDSYWLAPYGMRKPIELVVESIAKDISSFNKTLNNMITKILRRKPTQKEFESYYKRIQGGEDFVVLTTYESSNVVNEVYTVSWIKRSKADGVVGEGLKIMTKAGLPIYSSKASASRVLSGGYEDNINEDVTQRSTNRNTGESIIHKAVVPALSTALIGLGAKAINDKMKQKEEKDGESKDDVDLSRFSLKQRNLIKGDIMGNIIENISNNNNNDGLNPEVVMPTVSEDVEVTNNGEEQGVFVDSVDEMISNNVTESSSPSDTGETVEVETSPSDITSKAESDNEESKDRSFFGKLLDGLKEITSKAWGFVKKASKKVADTTVKIAKTIWDGAKKAGKWVAETGTSVLRSVWDFITSPFRGRSATA